MRKLWSLFTTLSVLLVTLNSASAQTADGSRAEVERRVESLLGKMTLEEKIDLLGGVDDFFIRALPRLNLSRLKMADGPIGVRNFGEATTMAGGIALTASWNPQLAERVGT